MLPEALYKSSLLPKDETNQLRKNQSIFAPIESRSENNPTEFAKKLVAQEDNHLFNWVF